tara:strand:- start:1152 stop:1496 length:345 start_codon:yes stop_codon:yes gene_type:complete
MSEEQSTTRYLVMWDCLGLEYLGDLTAWGKDQTWSALKDEKPKVKIPSLQVLMLRARYNSHRSYEIYLFDAVDLTEQDIRDAFKKSPQFMADFIRKNGDEIYSDRLEKNKRVII